MALRHLNLHNFVIVKTLDLDFASGFTVLTGETGAGKSILIDALQLVLGGRGDALWVRQGEKRCEIAAEFDQTSHAAPWLNENGFSNDENTLLLRRTIDAAGKSRGWINGSAATMNQLRELGEQLVDIHGQHAWQSLTRPAAVRQLFDAYAKIDTAALACAWQRCQEIRKQLENARAAQHQIAERRDQLTWQISELEPLSPEPDEWLTLDQQHTRLANAQVLIEAGQAAHQALDGDLDAACHGTSALRALANAIEALQQQQSIEPDFAPMIEALQACEAQVTDVAHDLAGYTRATDVDPAQLAQLDERVSLWLSLARRHHRLPAELPGLLADWRTELEQLDSATNLEHLQTVLQDAEKAYQEVGQRVSRQRQKAAPELGTAVTAAMQDLGMGGGVFQVGLKPLPQAGAWGLESIEFQMSANAGATPHAIDRIASGGELSRLALAINVITSQWTHAATLIFDEVDAGVGGTVANTVGRLLHQLGTDRQVLCVTHLAQVASQADHHLQVSKFDSDDGGTQSTVTPVIQDDRVREVTRMLGGHENSDAGTAHAREMLEQAQANREKTQPAEANP